MESIRVVHRPNELASHRNPEARHPAAMKMPYRRNKTLLRLAGCVRSFRYMHLCDTPEVFRISRDPEARRKGYGQELVVSRTQQAVSADLSLLLRLRHHRLRRPGEGGRMHRSRHAHQGRNHLGRGLQRLGNSRHRGSGPFRYGMRVG